MTKLAEVLKRLPEIKALAAAAEPGPWRRDVKTWDGDPIMVVLGSEREEVAQEPTQFSAYPSGAFITTEGLAANVDFIAAARTDAPALVEALEEAKALLERVNRISIIRADNLPSALGDSPTLLADIREALGQ